MGRPIATPASLGLLMRDRLPEPVNDLHRIALEVANRTLQVLAPEPSPYPGNGRAVGDGQVHLGVVEERVFVEVGRADSEPAVVDDAHLCVHIHRGVPILAARVDGAGEQPAGAVVGLHQRPELAPRVVAAAVRLRRQHYEKAKIRRGWPAQLIPEDGQDLR